MKASAKRRRSKRQIEEEKLQAEKEAKEIKKKVSEYDQMKKEMEEYEALKARFATNQSQLDTAVKWADHLVDAGVLDRDEAGGLSLSQQQPQVSGNVLQADAHNSVVLPSQDHDQIKSSMVVDQTPGMAQSRTSLQPVEQETIAQKLRRQEASHYGVSDEQLLEDGYQKLESALSSK